MRELNPMKCSSQPSFDHRPTVLVIGPGPMQVGGVATFIQFLVHSEYLNRRFAIVHMETTRKRSDIAKAGRFSFRNVLYLLDQVLQLFNTLRKTRPQIVHVSVTGGWSFWKVALFMLLGRAFRAKVIAHVHGGAFDLFFERSHPFIKWMIAKGLGWADMVVALSTWWKDFFLQQVAPSLNIAVIHNCPQEAFAYCGDAPPRSAGKGNTILFVGSIGKRKGVFDILTAVPVVVSGFASARFVFLGEEEFSGEKQQTIRICRERKLEKYVSFPGRVIGGEKYQHYQQADIFILPSHAENLPFSILEAMSMGLPIVTTPVGGIPEIVEDGVNGYLIPPGNDAMLAEKILLLLESPRLREQMSIANWRKIQEHFQPEAIARQWETLYCQVLMSEPPSPSPEGTQEFKDSRNI